MKRSWFFRKHLSGRWPAIYAWPLFETYGIVIDKTQRKLKFSTQLEVFTAFHITSTVNFVLLDNYLNLCCLKWLLSCLFLIVPWKFFYFFVSFDFFFPMKITSSEKDIDRYVVQDYLYCLFFVHMRTQCHMYTFE